LRRVAEIVNSMADCSRVARAASERVDEGFVLTVQSILLSRQYPRLACVREQ
jgi:hypothetical protein